MKRSLYVACLVFIVSACSSKSITPVNQQTTSVSIPSITTTPTNTATLPPTNTPKPTPTITTVPADVLENALATYRAILLVHVTANLLNETSIQVRDGKLEGLDRLKPMILLKTLVDELDADLGQVKVTEELKPFFEHAVAIHAVTSDTWNRWLNSEIESKDLVPEYAPNLIEIENVISEADQIMHSKYGYKMSTLEAAREDVFMQTVDLLTATPPATTATP